jgi:hypothetical protein
MSIKGFLLNLIPFPLSRGRGKIFIKRGGSPSFRRTSPSPLRERGIKGVRGFYLAL